jgi:thiol-disulfide isomerase/thioredoxin
MPHHRAARRDTPGSPGTPFRFTAAFVVRMRSLRGVHVPMTALAALLCLAPAAGARDKAAAPVAAPVFVLPGRSGEVSLAALRGRVVYVDFWASWCGPCRASFPWMSQFAERERAKGLAVVAINLDKDRTLADAFLSQYLAPEALGPRDSFQVAFDPAGKTAEAYHVQAMPTSFLIGKDGTILLRHAGFDPRRTADLEQHIEEALAR